MKKIAKIYFAALVLVAGPLTFSSANSLGIENVQYVTDLSEVSITLTFDVNYDFNEFAMFGGGLDLIYDPDSVAFVSYVQAPLAPDAQSAASPLGQLVEPGLYEGFGIGTFEFFNGMTSAGTIGTFTFEVLDFGLFNDTPCGFELCLQGNPVNPFVSLAGEQVTDELLADGLTGLPVFPPLPVPVPGAVWMMLGAMSVLRLRSRRR